MKKVLVITSGGLDSAVLLHHHVNGGDWVRALAIDYGQRHKCELQCAEIQAFNLSVPFAVAHLPSLASIIPGSSQTSDVPVPEGHYTAENMKATVVPNRNMILLAVAIGHAIATEVEFVSYAAHSGDHAIYPDCRPEFADAMDAVAKVCHETPLGLLRPFIRKTKAEIVTYGSELNVDFAQTYSCYQGKPGVHCGRCGTCCERAESFQVAGVPDPTVYTDPDYFRQVMAEHLRLGKLPTPGQ